MTCAVQYSKHVNPLRQYDIVDDVLELAPANRPNISPDDSKHLRHRLDLLEPFSQAAGEVLAETDSNFL
jgi:hypothetical protein